jgi:hypothetical protein
MHMKKMTSSDNLKLDIELLEANRSVKLQQLKEEYFIGFESLKPLNLVKSTFKELTSPNLLITILGTALSLATGYFTKRLIVGASVNGFRRLFGTVMQFGITTIIAKNTKTIDSFKRNVFQAFRKKRLT